MLETPSAYTDGYAKARLEDQALADNYIKHTTMGDAVLDPVMEELSSPPPGDLHRFIEGGIKSSGPRSWPKPRRFLATFSETSKILPGLTSKRFVPVFAPSTQTSTLCLSPSSRGCS